LALAAPILLASSPSWDGGVDVDVGEVVTEALRSFGSSVCSVTLYYLEAKMNVKRDELCRNPEALVKVLREIFGPLSSFIEEQLAYNIAVKLGLREALSLTQLLALISKKVGLKSEVSTEAVLKGGLLDIVHRLASRLQQLGAKLAELELGGGVARLKAEGGSLFTTKLSNYYKEAVAELKDRGGLVEARIKIVLQGAWMSEEERRRLKEEASRLLQGLTEP